MAGQDTAPHRNILVIVAHPDDETLWCGGTILMHPEDTWLVVCLSRGLDMDRNPRFHTALEALNARGIMGDLEDGPLQNHLDKELVKVAIVALLPDATFDLVLTHSPTGEYTRHLRHEEIGQAVIELWNEHRISTEELWTFAFEDGQKQYYPQAIRDATLHLTLPESVWQEKYRIIREIYGFEASGFEASTTPKEEAFWKFKNRRDAQKWLEQDGI